MTSAPPAPSSPSQAVLLIKICSFSASCPSRVPARFLRAEGGSWSRTPPTMRQKGFGGGRSGDVKAPSRHLDEDSDYVALLLGDKSGDALATLPGRIWAAPAAWGPHARFTDFSYFMKRLGPCASAMAPFEARRLAGCFKAPSSAQPLVRAVAWRFAQRSSCAHADKASCPTRPFVPPALCTRAVVCLATSAQPLVQHHAALCPRLRLTQGSFVLSRHEL